MTPWARWWSRLRLANRIVLLMLVLLLLVQSASFWVVRRALDQQVAGEIQATLEVGERVLQRLLAQNAERLQEAAVVLAADFGFRSAIASGDQATVASALENSGNRIGAPMVALLDPAYQLVVASQADNSMAAQTLKDLGVALAQGQQGSRLALIEQQPYHFVMVPVRAPVVVGWVLIGIPLQATLLDDLHRLADVEAMLFSPGAQAKGWLSSQPQGAMAQWLTEASRQAASIRTTDDVLVARYADLNALGGDLRVVLLRSTRQATEPFRQLQWMLGVITLGGLVLFALGSYRAARRVTRPLNALTEVTQALEQGDFQVTVPGTERGDEVGSLARGFDRMRTSLAAQREEISRLAYWDRLTGLPNREQFRQHLASAIDGGKNVAKPLVVITLNLDRFKHVNDVLGYGSGDELLRGVASRLKALVRREGDLVARLAGDEFAILLSRTSLDGAMQLTEQITKAFETPLAFDDQTVDLSASMGVACWPSDAEDADLLMSRSEIAMYAAKTKTAGVLRYTPVLDSSSTQTLSLLSDLRQALQQGELRLFLQPKVDVATRQVVAAEALVRWQHPQRGLVPPLQFIPFAEQTGFVRQLTLWMFEEAARQWAALQSAQGPLRIAINLSTRDLLDPYFAERLAGLMREHGVQADAFCLEITESAIMDDPQRAEATLNLLAEQGFKLSIDDFGTGYSSLAYLKRLPVNELKIDKSFVMGMEQDDNDAKIVRSTVDLAHNLGLRVVAEGVENEAILNLLNALGCDEAQGYFVSKPMPAHDFKGWRARWNAALTPEK